MPSTFLRPPLDGSITIPEMWDWHYRHNPTCPVFRYETPPDNVHVLTYETVVSAGHQAGEFLLKAIGASAQDTVKPRIAIIATTDTITFFCTLMGAMRAGICTAIISPHNSTDAVAHLLNEVAATHVFISEEDAVQTLASGTLEIIQDEHSGLHNSAPFTVAKMPTPDQIFISSPGLKLSSLGTTPRWLVDRESPVVYTHSSGSTSLPKPLAWNHSFLLQVGFAPIDGHHDFANQLFSWHGVSMSHGTGVHLLSWIPTSGFSVAVFPPQSPAKPFTTGAAWEGFVQSTPDYAVLFPHVLEEWANDPNKVERLKSAKGVIWLGGFLNREIGNELAVQGLKLFPLYGMAEAVNQGLDWEYFSMTPRGGSVFRQVSENIYELILVQSPTRPLAATNTDYLGSNAYATKDLFQKHPLKDGFWKPVGRMDDLIALSNNKKVNPLPLENILNRDPRIWRALLFGEGQPFCGALVDLRPEYASDVVSSSQAQEMKNALSDVIKRTSSAEAGGYEIPPQMILFTQPEKPFQYTEKGSIRRGRILEDYISEIIKLYADYRSAE
ncbi:hypothetical protein ONZ45_g5545 [Pleurotus djamor]|nr:hypothetical protein ONZ45_g5545 [Pleurotus djamor]